MITGTMLCTCRIAMLYKCRCDAKLVRRQADNQPEADNADNFTTWNGSLEHTSVNCVFGSSPSSPSPAQVRSPVHPKAIMSRHFPDSVPKFRRSSKQAGPLWEWGSGRCFILCHETTREQQILHNDFALFHPLPAVRRYSMSGGLKELRISIHTKPPNADSQGTHMTPHIAQVKSFSSFHIVSMPWHSAYLWLMKRSYILPSIGRDMVSFSKLQTS